MPTATLTLTIPDDMWIGELTREYADTRFQVLAALPSGDTGVGLAKLTGSNIEALVSALEDYDEVTDLAILEHTDGTVLVQLETTLPILLEPARKSGIPLEMPFSVQAGEVHWELTASRDRLSALHTQLKNFGIQVSVESIHPDIEPTSLLTDQQWDVIETAVQEGYYDTPRTCTQESLAEKLDLAKSTCSETLHRAEERIIKQFVSEQRDELNEPGSPEPAVA